MSDCKRSFIIVAGGTGSRMGGTPKQFRNLQGVPLWMWSVKTAEKLFLKGLISELIIVVPENSVKTVSSLLNTVIPSKVVCGGKNRAESVMNGLKNSCGSHVLVHDGARPFITESLCTKLINEAGDSSAAIPLLPSADSLKYLSDKVIECPDRAKYFRTQTPQLFPREELIKTMEEYGLMATDEATAWINKGYDIKITAGEECNFKITTPYDWERAVLMTNENREYRTGHGYDIHQLVPGRKLILAGISIEDSPLGLLGYSDADIVIHTVMDAILGAAGEPDIGTIFPASDNKWKDADSTELLSSVLKIVREKGWKIHWVDVTLTAQTPKLGHMVQSFKKNMCSYLKEDTDTENFNIKIKSGEYCGAVGRSECMICHGVATLTRIQPSYPQK